MKFFLKNRQMASILTQDLPSFENCRKILDYRVIVCLRKVGKSQHNLFQHLALFFFINFDNKAIPQKRNQKNVSKNHTIHIKQIAHPTSRVVFH